MHDLVDTQQMYLRTLLELEEEGIVGRKARIAERLDQSVPTVNETVGRMIRRGLVEEPAPRRLALTVAGRKRAAEIMRRHRVLEVFLDRVVGLDLALVHDEACALEHVVSQAAEDRIFELVERPEYSPYGNRINPPGVFDPEIESQSARPLTEAPDGGHAVVRWYSEQLQKRRDVIALFRASGIGPGSAVEVAADEGVWRIRAEGRAGGEVGADGATGVELDEPLARWVFVTPA